MTQNKTDWRDAGWDAAIEPGRLLGLSSTGLEPIDQKLIEREDFLNLDRPFAIISVTLNEWGGALALAAFDIERDRDWSWVALAEDVRSRVLRVCASLDKGHRGMDMDYTQDYAREYSLDGENDRLRKTLDQAFCIGVGDAWRSNSISDSRAVDIAFWSVARELAARGVVSLRLPDPLARLVLSEENLSNGFLDPEPLAKNARSLFLPYLEALSLQTHIPDEAPARARSHL